MNITAKNTKDYQVDFGFDKPIFYLNYFGDNLKGVISMELEKGYTSVDYHYNRGDYYGPENDSGPLPGGYYGGDYEIDDIDIAMKYADVIFFDEEGETEISKESFLELNNNNEDLVNEHLVKAENAFYSEIEDYIADHLEDLI